MPIQGSTLRIGPRSNVMERDLYDKFIKETGSTISYTQFRTIVTESLVCMRNKLINNTMGLKMPFDLGFAIVTRFKPDKATRSIDWKKSKEYNTRVYFIDKTYGYKPRINWITKKMSTCRYINIYKFVPDRELTRGVGRIMADGKEYNDFTHDHFRQLNISVNYTRLNNGQRTI